MKTETSAVDINRGIGDFAYPEVHVRDAGTGLSEKTIHYISDVKEDPDWVRSFALEASRHFWKNRCPRIGRARISKQSTSIKSVIISRPGPRRNAVGMKCRRTSSAHSSASGFPSRSENFSPESKHSSTAKPFTRTSRRRSANKASFSWDQQRA